MKDRYERTLDDIYSSYMSVKRRIAGKFDRDVRDPSIILDLARSLGVLPPPDGTVKITGSKGKGTTSRLIARMLGDAGAGRVGLLVSPEEFEHTDRMTIDGAAIPAEAFCDIHDALAGPLRARAARFHGDQYLSPSGIFLLIALTWFKRNGVDWYVLETGRGARHDEVGNIPSRIAVVTSILYEHPSYLGPTLRDIAREKMFVAENSDSVRMAAGFETVSATRYANVRLSTAVAAGDLPFAVPAWYWTDFALARDTVGSLIPGFDPAPFAHSTSFGARRVGARHLYYDAAISTDSLDPHFMARLREKHPGSEVHSILSLPDDKDVAAISQQLSRFGFSVHHVPMTGTRGYLHYERTRSEFGGAILSEVQYDDVNGLRTAIEDRFPRQSDQVLYFMGTQTFIRLVKKAFFS